MTDNIFSKLVALFILVGMILFTVYQSFEKQDELASQNASQVITKFVDNVRTKGYISPQMIEEFERDIEIGSYMFKIEYEHERKVYTPIYTDPTNPATFTGEYTVDFDNYYGKQIMEHLFSETDPVEKDDRKYLLSAGDFFTVHAENINRTNATMLLDFLTNGNSGDGVIITPRKGGMILNEDF